MATHPTSRPSPNLDDFEHLTLTEVDLQGFLDLEEWANHPVPESSDQTIIIDQKRRKLLLVLPSESFASIKLSFQPTRAEIKAAFAAIKPGGAVVTVTEDGSISPVERPQAPRTHENPPARRRAHKPAGQPPRLPKRK